MSETSTHSGTATPCVECDSMVPVAIWDDAVLAGYHHPICITCHDDVPEENLWEVDDDASHPVVDLPDAPPEGEDWAVRDVHAGWKEDLREQHGEVPDWAADREMGEKFEIIVRDISNTEAIKAAREEIRRRLAN